ncbi:hypothetical protein MB84_29390 (plasmid) [Pandoraea oxalativorans]|uniref:Tetratricopeptide repeat protein n=1 Tax=Pandoraea oxalativorans TaxID=573737 RepID=A0A0G3IGA4_9BURK|nr:hypothetical protein MB84_29390 [Pandoraea oxalativorans]
MATLDTVRFSDPASVGRAYRKLSALPFFEGTWDKLLHKGHKADNRRAVVTLAFYKRAMERGEDPTNVPGDHHAALTLLANNLSAMGETALNQSVAPGHEAHEATNPFSRYLGLSERHLLAALVRLAQADTHAPGSPECAKANTAAAEQFAAASLRYAGRATQPTWAALTQSTRYRSADATLASGLAHWEGQRPASAVMACLSALDTFTTLALPEPAARAREALNTIVAAVAMQDNTQALLEALAKRRATGQQFETLASLHEHAGQRTLAQTALRHAGQVYSQRGEDDAAQRCYIDAGTLDLAAISSERIAHAAPDHRRALQAYRQAIELFDKAGLPKEVERVRARAAEVEATQRASVREAAKPTPVARAEPETTGSPDAQVKRPAPQAVPDVHQALEPAPVASVEPETTGTPDARVERPTPQAAKLGAGRPLPPPGPDVG